MTDEMNKLRVAHEKQRAETKELYESELAYYKSKLADASRAVSVGSAHEYDVDEIVNESESRIQVEKTAFWIFTLVVPFPHIFNLITGIEKLIRRERTRERTNGGKV